MIAVSNERTLSQIKSARFLNWPENLLETMKNTLASGEDLMISRFGRFQVIDKVPRKGRNPATGKEIILEGRRVLTFKCSQKLRNQINACHENKKSGIVVPSQALARKNLREPAEQSIRPNLT